MKDCDFGYVISACIFGLFAGWSLGSYEGDTSTLVSCAKSGEARLIGGVTIACVVKAEPKK